MEPEVPMPPLQGYPIIYNLSWSRAALALFWRKHVKVEGSLSNVLYEASALAGISLPYFTSVVFVLTNETFRKEMHIAWSSHCCPHVPVVQEGAQACCYCAETRGETPMTRWKLATERWRIASKNSLTSFHIYWCCTYGGTSQLHGLWNPRCNVAFTGTLQSSLSWVKSTQSLVLLLISLKSILVLVMYSHQHVGIPKVLLPAD